MGAKEFPAFFTPHSGFESPHHVKDEAHCAQIIGTVTHTRGYCWGCQRAVFFVLIPTTTTPTDAHHQLNLQSGMIVAVPIPEEQAAEARGVQSAIDMALREAT